VRPPVAQSIPTRGLGAWLARRSDGRRLHAGVDLRMGADEPCFAPESGTVDAVWESNRPRPDAQRFSRPPGWSGYGPKGVRIRGDSGVWHVLAHLDTVGVQLGQRVTEGEAVGRGSVVRHVHWEVRTAARPPSGAAVVEVTLDPGAWLRGERVPWAGQCPEAPGSTRDTPRSCRPGARRTTTRPTTTTTTREGGGTAPARPTEAPPGREGVPDGS
jgi:murein DD-endopeptidase MepM/ murein hydrolase activator NlpD